MQTSEISTSGILQHCSVELDGRFTEFSEMKRMSYCRLVKAKRYGRWFVLKCLLPQFAGQSLYESLLLKEAEITLRFEHQNIVRCYGCEKIPNYGICVVLEYVDGVTLSELLTTKPSSTLLKKMVGEVLSAMSYFHALQVVHRDLKPSNILVTRNGHNIKVIDFGLSDSDNYAVLKQPAGTLKYISPEQRDGGVQIDARSDIYSFGVLLHQLFSGRFAPFYSYLSHKCANPNRDKRFQSADEIIAFIKRYRSVRVAVPSVFLLMVAVLGVLWGSFARQNNPELPVRDTVKIVTEVKQLPVRDTVMIMPEKTSLPVQDNVKIVPETKQFPPDTVFVQKEIVKVIHDTIRIPNHLTKERINAHKRMTDYVDRQMMPIRKRLDNGGFRYNITFHTSVTNCYMYCQKQLRKEMKDCESPTYPKSVLFHDIDSVVGSVTSLCRSEYADVFPLYLEATIALRQRLDSDSKMSESEKQRLNDSLDKRYKDDIINYE